MGCIYRSPNSTDDNNNNLCKLIRDVQKINSSHLLIMGDFNLPSVNWYTWAISHDRYDSFDYSFTNCLRDCYLHQHIQEPTRVRKDQTPSILDLIITNEEGMISKIAYMSPIGKSDHCSIYFDFHCYTQDYNINVKNFRYKKGNYIYMNNLLSLDWTTILSDLDVQSQWNLILIPYNLSTI